MDNINPVAFVDEIIDRLKSLDSKFDRIEAKLGIDPKEKSTNYLFNDADRLTIIQASEFTGLTVKTLYNKSSRRLIPHEKMGGKLIFSKKKLIEWFDKNKVTRQTVKQ